ncbi:hypothetical protein [Halolamina sediminis]|jgi:hypothetical protein|uniref:hypothetical protein n=1 Tax=Halolamina sediminis TaxID=1480675 RepID=UPI0006B5A9E7|nr:hypothetical protein [Halolamina sediminis]
MGSFADDVGAYLRRELSARRPTVPWETEYRIGGTPVDLGGRTGERLVLVELEWRRADPADNTAKLCRHVAEGSIEADTVVVFQLFTRYYDLASGGVSSKRKNAEFVGRTVADVSDHVTYYPLDFDVAPPKRGGDRPDGWRDAANAIATAICDRLDGSSAPEE